MARQGASLPTTGRRQTFHAPAAQRWRQPLPVRCDEDRPTASVALGKFDALHKGHQALAETAARGPCQPAFLLSFGGMAEVLGWKARLPLVAAVDRGRILKDWARRWNQECDGEALDPPAELVIPFAQVWES